MNVLLVSGTDTEVGKTIITSALAALAQARGDRVAVVKPVQTGVTPGEAGDLAEVERLTGLEDLHELARLAEPLAPGTAARRAEVQLPSVADMARFIEQLESRDLVLVEGSGGLLVDLDGQGGTLADLALALASPVLVVVRPGLGSLNHTALTCEALRVRGLSPHGIAIGAWPAAPDLATRCNLADLPVYAGCPLLGSMPEKASALDPGAFLAAAQEGFAFAPQEHLTQEVPA